MKRIEESLGSVVRIGSVRSFGGGVLVGVEFWVGWCWLGRSFGLCCPEFWVGVVLVLGDFSWWGEKICCDWAKL